MIIAYGFAIISTICFWLSIMMLVLLARDKDWLTQFVAVSLLIILLPLVVFITYILITGQYFDVLQGQLTSLRS